MKLTPPTNLVFMIAFILAALALLSVAVPVPVIGPNRFWFMTAAWGALSAGVFFKGI